MSTTSRSIRGTGQLGRRTRRVLGALAALVLALAPVQVQAGCGCEKPPPPPAQVRPQVSYAGMPITIRSTAFVAGQAYDVTFTSMSGQTATVSGVVGTRRDLADGQSKKQLEVELPALPLGPAAISVKAVGASMPLLTLPDSAFTVAPTPIALPTTYGTWSYPNHQAAVDRDGTVYLSLDLTGMTAPLVFEAEFNGYPLRFAEQDLVFMNTQGFLMQLLTEPGNKKSAVPMPGMSVNPSATPTTTSDTLHYSRHEFHTYHLQHFERQPHAVDASDPSWHLDGTRHIDHDHLIVAILGHKNDGTLPGAGATPPFELRLRAYSLFYQGLVGDSAITMKSSSATESLDRTTGLVGDQGDVSTDGKLTMSGAATIRGDATAASFAVGSSCLITGARITDTTPMTFMEVKLPTGLTDLKTLSLSGTTRTIVGPGSFQLDKLSLASNARLFIDNTAGPVTFYVKGAVTVGGGSNITVADPNPEKFAIYVLQAKGNSVSVTGNGSSFYGVIYAPTSTLTVNGTGIFTGAFVAKTLTTDNSARIRYDSSLRGQPDPGAAQATTAGTFRTLPNDITFLTTLAPQ